MRLEFAEIAKTLKAAIRGEGPAVVTSVSTDTRTVHPGDLFVALRGEKYDGHDYVADAVARGAAAVVVDHPVETAVDQLLVPDTLYALGEIARLWRSKNARIPLAVIVGSNGKTTTKEMVASVVAQRRRALITEANLNNLIGVAHTLLRLQPDHEAVVLEMGMNQAGELARLVEMAQPDCILLVNITNAHVGNFGDIEGLYQAKCDALRNAPPGALLIMNADDPLSQRARAEYAGGRRVVSFGLAPECDVRAAGTKPLAPFGFRFRLEVPGNPPAPVSLHVFGRHNIHNALGAAAVAAFFGVGADEIAQSLSDFRPRANRSEVEELDGWYLVKDYYNASPAAVEAALRALADFQVPGRRWAVLADMLELGPMEAEFHARIGRVAAETGLEMLYTLGERGRMIHAAAAEAGQPAEHLESVEDAAARLRGFLRAGDAVLVKGSRLMKLERIYALLKGPGPEPRP